MSDVPADHLRVSIWPPRRQGGQQVGTDHGVEIEHIPTGILARVNIGASQHTNKTIAMDMILSALTHPRFR